ncbi:putative mipc synthase subunit protein [Botrytis fragariae]|uniref:Putative mipc synthase subunit protein n=1 Tax=Botrytis fragariae TaxID=1964551 RepID=A0A8H6EDU1_9HELO|nr:putative mipc synthase subunit protein [Botrytis fragariae]KAF5868501.1 putative mipc synthase subunit protein [Botrytis fragariae]
MISLHYHRILLFFFLLLLSLIVLLHLTYPSSLNFNLNLNPLSTTNSNSSSRKHTYITKEGKSINQQNVIQLRAKIKEGKYPALRKLLEDGVLGVGEKTGEKSGKGGGGEKIIHQVWHNWKGGFGRRVERRGDENVDGRVGEGRYDMRKGKISIAEDKEGWEISGGDGEIPHGWEERRRSCRGVNEQSGWKYVLWTSQKSLAFIKTYYSSFLKTYISYPSNFQRVEAMKFLLLHRYGGIVLDVDTICLRALDPFLMLGLFVVSEPLVVSEDDGEDGDEDGDEKRKGTLSTRIIGAPRNHGFVVELIDVLMGYNAPRVDGDGERERNKAKGVLSLTGKLRKGEKLMMGRREVFGEVWDAYHRRIGEGVLGVGVTNTSGSMGDKSEREDREELGLVDSVGWRVSVLRTGEGAGRGFFGPHPLNSKPTSLPNSKPQSKTSHLLLPVLILITLSLLITLIFYSHHRSHTRKQPLIRRASSKYERGRRRERVLRGAGLGGGNGGSLFHGYGGGVYGEEVMEGMEKEGRGLMIGGVGV